MAVRPCGGFQGGDEGGGGGEAVVRALRQRLAQNFLDVRGKLTPELAGRRHRFGHVGEEHGCRRIGSEGHTSGQHLVGNDGEGVDI